jgi:hypothetical protein
MPDGDTKVAEGTGGSKYRDLLRSLREKYLPNQFVESFCSCKLLPNLYIGRIKPCRWTAGPRPPSLQVVSVP